MSRSRKLSASAGPASRAAALSPRPSPAMGGGESANVTWFDPLAGFLWLAMGCLLVARQLVPTEGAPQGETLLLPQLWFGVLLVWVWKGYRDGGIRFRWGQGDLAVALFVGGHILSAGVVLATGGDKRAAGNLLWEWAGMGSAYFLVRQLCGTLERRYLALIFTALAVALSGYGIWQRAVWYPQQVAAYDALRDALDEVEQRPPTGDPRENYLRQQRGRKLQQELLELGVGFEMQSGAGRDLFESRLRDSQEPLGRFALANTFAGLLLAWLVVLASVAAREIGTVGRRRVLRAVVLGCALALIAYCLILTKSRTAYLGLASGLLLVALSHVSLRQLPSRRLALAGGLVAIIVVLLAGMAAATGGLDRLVLEEAPKSLKYRVEYWRGTWEVIREHPLLGVGPGNFRPHYLAHKLPESSEEIADPHNMFLDAWASGGLLALAGLIGICLWAGGFVWRGARPHSPAAGLAPTAASPDSRPHETPVPRMSEGEPSDVRLTMGHPLVWGTGLAFAVLGLWSGFIELSFVGLAVGSLVCIAMFVSLLGFPGPSGAGWGAALVALLIHLLGAGGIGMPAVTETALCLFACGLLAAPGSTRERTIRARGAVIAAAAMSVGLFLACHFTATRPVFLRQSYQAAGDAARSGTERRTQYRLAAAVDPWSAEPWERLAGLEYQQWENAPESDEPAFERAVASGREAIARNPHAFSGYRFVGQLYAARFRRTKVRADAEQAALWLTRTVERYPHHAALLAELAEACSEAGRQAEARENARRALAMERLNRAAGHRDKYLPEQRVRELKRLESASGPEERKPTRETSGI